MESSSADVTLSSLEVTRAVSTGIRVSASARVAVSQSSTHDNGLHGIGVSDSPQLVLTGNTSDHNQATTGSATATGIDLSGATPDARVVGNVVWANQASGIQLGSGVQRALLARNLSHHNAQHGFHLLGATAATLLNNTSVANTRTGLLLEGSATGARLANNLLVDDGLSADYDLSVDTSSMPGFVADYDVAWNNTTRSAVRVGAATYRRLVDYAAASGQEAARPLRRPRLRRRRRWRPEPAGRLHRRGLRRCGSPGFVADAPWTPVDDPAVADRGAGSPTYADRGALELQPSGAANHAPRAALVLGPAQSTVPPAATVTVDASGSTDTDAFPIESYAFDFGDGTTVAPQASPVTTHVYTATGTYTVTVTVRDTGGLVDSASATEVVSARPATTWQVDRASSACSDSGPGTPTRPFCTIGAGTRAALAGDTVRVAPGTYPEQVSLTRSGQAGAPIQVLGSPGTLVSGDNVATGAPGARSYGFLVRNVNDVVVDGFAVRDAAVNGIELDTDSRVTVSNMDVTGNGSYGLSADHSSSVVVDHIASYRNGSIGVRLRDDTDSQVRSSQTHDNASHGVSVQASTRSTVHGVDSWANDRPTDRSANGIDVSAGSVDTVVEDNRTWDNDDSGIESYTDARGTVVRRNISWDNGDHGIDNYRAPGSVIVSNTVVGNTTAGINLEGTSTGGTVRDNVTMDNAVGSPRTRAEIRVDKASTPGTTLDRNLVFQTSGGALYEWNGVRYTSRASFTAASGQEAAGLAANPLFVNVGGCRLPTGGRVPRHRRCLCRSARMGRRGPDRRAALRRSCDPQHRHRLSVVRRPRRARALRPVSHHHFTEMSRHDPR